MKLELATQDNIESWKSIYNDNIYPLFYNTLGVEIRDHLHKIENINIWGEYACFFIKDDEDKTIWSIYYKSKDPITAYINWFYILPEYQYKWYWKQAFELLIKHLIYMHYEHMYLETRLEYIWATSFYESMNLEKIESNDILNNHYVGNFYKTLVPNSVFYYKKIY